MVRLKRVIESYKNNELNLFKSQFHYGSIKTMIKELLLNAVIVESQFHYGSIKTRTITKPRLP